MEWISYTIIVLASVCGWAGIMLVVYGTRMPVEKQTIGKKFMVEYSGGMEQYKGAKRCYSAGARVVLRYSLIATDTVYDFYLDGENLNYDYDEKNGFILSFTMPPHNVKLELRQKNISVCE